MVASADMRPVDADINYLTPPKPEEMESEGEGKSSTSVSKPTKLHKKYTNPFLATSSSRPTDGSRHARLKANTLSGEYLGPASIERNKNAHMSR